MTWMTMGKKSDLSEFDRGLVVGVRRAGLSISEAANLLGFSRTTVSRVYREWTEKKTMSSGRQSCGRKCIVDDGGQRRLDRLIQGDREATVSELTLRYNDGLQKTISERTTRRTLKRLGYSKTPLGTTHATGRLGHEAKISSDSNEANQDNTKSTKPDNAQTLKLSSKGLEKGWQV